MKRAFTLIELITVISVIAILAGVVTPLMGSIMDEARVARMTSDIHTLKTALIAFNYRNGYYPYAGLSNGTSAYAYVQPPDSGRMGTLNTLLSRNLAKRIVDDPWRISYGYWFYLAHPTVPCGAVCSYGPDRTNNGVWNATIWYTSGVTPGDDYYDCFYKRQ